MKSIRIYNRRKTTPFMYIMAAECVNGISTKDISTKEISTKEISTKKMSTKEISTKGISMKGFSTKGFSTKGVTHERIKRLCIDNPGFPGARRHVP
jgi:hypothetical protein